MKSGTHRERKLLITVPSTPVMNEGAMGNGNSFAATAGPRELALDVEVLVAGAATSNEIFAIASWSSTSKDGKRLIIWLKGCV